MPAETAMHVVAMVVDGDDAHGLSAFGEQDCSEHSGTACVFSINSNA